MGRLRFVVGACVAVVVPVGACAKAVVDTSSDGGQTDGTVTPTDAHVDAPSDGACVAPQIKCSGSQTCIDLTNDPNHCGTCGTTCAGPDGGPDTGTGNPDSGIPIPDGGFDAGTGWALPTSSCDASKCELACATGSNLCSDNLCWDPQNAHDHCGGCSTACATDIEWCTRGHCCSTGQDYCGGACTDVLSDKNNCGACGNVCGVSTPVCLGGTCTTQVSVTTICSKSNPTGIFCGGNCTNNHAQYADAYCKLAGLTSAVSYTVLTSGSVSCLYYNTTLPTTCSEIQGPATYGLASYCDAIQNLVCQ